MAVVDKPDLSCKTLKCFACSLHGSSLADCFGIHFLHRVNMLGLAGLYIAPKGGCQVITISSKIPYLMIHCYPSCKSSLDSLFRMYQRFIHFHFFFIAITLHVAVVRPLFSSMLPGVFIQASQNCKQLKLRKGFVIEASLWSVHMVGSVSLRRLVCPCLVFCGTRRELCQDFRYCPKAICCNK